MAIGELVKDKEGKLKYLKPKQGAMIPEGLNNHGDHYEYWEVIGATDMTETYTLASIEDVRSFIDCLDLQTRRNLGLCPQ